MIAKQCERLIGPALTGKFTETGRLLHVLTVPRRAISNAVVLACNPRLTSILAWLEGEIIITTLKVPKTGGIPTTKANVVRWLKREGDTIKVGEPIVELETEKVSYELESPTEGILLKIMANENTQVPVGEALCQIGPAA